MAQRGHAGKPRRARRRVIRRAGPGGDPPTAPTEADARRDLCATFHLLPDLRQGQGVRQLVYQPEVCLSQGTRLRVR